LTLTLLGPPHIEHAGQRLTFAYEKVQALLVYLAVEAGRIHHRTALAELFWPEQPKQASRHSLSQALFSLRRSVRDDPDNPLLLTSRDAVRLNPTYALWVDVVTFRRLILDTDSNIPQMEQAIELYAGEFLGDFGIGGSAAFEEWALLLREQLRVQAGDLLRRLTDPRDGVADPSRRRDYARRWVDLDPLSEETQRRLIRALAEAGQRAAALAQFQQCRRILQAELGIEPEPATLALYEELQRAAPAAPNKTLPSRRPVLAANAADRP
jgi:DNA-binding SARP family transcriptional activator